MCAWPKEYLFYLYTMYKTQLDISKIFCCSDRLRNGGRNEIRGNVTWEMRFGEIRFQGNVISGKLNSRKRNSGNDEIRGNVTRGNEIRENMTRENDSRGNVTRRNEIRGNVTQRKETQGNVTQGNEISGKCYFGKT
jgi:hypothetical protein